MQHLYSNVFHTEVKNIYWSAQTIRAKRRVASINTVDCKSEMHPTLLMVTRLKIKIFSGE